MLRHASAHADEVVLIELVLHHVHVLMNPLDIVTSVSSRVVPAVKRRRASAKLLESSRHTERKSREGTLTVLKLEQLPRLLDGDFYREGTSSARSRFRCDATPELPGDATIP